MKTETSSIYTLVSILADGKFYSSEYLEKHLRINHSIINKYVEILQNLGLDIIIFPGKGYSLFRPIQLLNKTLIQSHIVHNSVTVLPVIDSTNQYLLNHINMLHSGDVCIAECQQDGRGRNGRKWFSPFGSSLYISMYWHFNNKPLALIGLSLAVAIVIAELLHDFGVHQVRLKWPNDLYVLNRKLAGILIEMISKNSNTIQTVIGIGINLFMRSLQTKGMDQKWINLQEIGIDVNRNTFAIKVIKQLQVLLEHFEQDGFTPFFPRWERLNNFINHPVKLFAGNKKIYGIFRGINERGALILEQDNIIKLWTNEEISLRVIA